MRAVVEKRNPAERLDAPLDFNDRANARAVVEPAREVAGRRRAARK